MGLKNYRLKAQRTTRGLGLFTLQAIPADKRIIEYKGPVITSEEVKTRGGRYLFELNQNYAIDGSSRQNLARYINHSCKPNSEAYVSGRRIWIWSKQAIAAGEEITIDYGDEYVNEFIKPAGCKCELCVTQDQALAAG
jgi:SET domain-containing protein